MQEPSGDLFGMEKAPKYDPNEPSYIQSQIPNWREDPITFLLQLMSKQKKTALIKIFIGPGMFRCEISVDENQAVGSGRTEDDAKEAAAKAFIDKFVAIWNFPMPLDDPEPLRCPAERSPKRRKLRPKKKAKSENFMRVLHDFCVLEGLPLPRYTLESQSHPEDSMKTVYMSCNVQDLQEYGAGRTRHFAKQRAAEAMWEQLNIRMNAERSRRMIE